ncbi:TetR/AcrR family transcriptional regulator [Novosphingobium colocasiae]
MTHRPIITKARRLSKDKRMADILHVARAVLRERGSDQFATGEVARLCGVSEGTIYKYFASRRDLLIKVAEAWFEEFVEDEHPHDRSLSVRERLMLGVRQHLSIIRAEPALTRFLLTDLRSDPQYRTMRIYQLNRQAAQRFFQHHRRWRGERRFPRRRRCAAGAQHDPGLHRVLDMVLSAWRE